MKHFCVRKSSAPRNDKHTHTHSYTYKWCMSIIIKTQKRVKKRLVRSRESLSDNFHWWNINKNMPLNHITWHIHAHSNTHTHTQFFFRSNFRQINKIYSCGNMVRHHKMPCWNVCECVFVCVCVRVWCAKLFERMLLHLYA